MKGVILGIAPDARIIDISHVVRPHDVTAAAFLLRSAYSHFPAGTVHCAVVDPGVGTSRLPVAVETEHYRFVGPDNGLLTLVLRAEGAVDHVGKVTGGRAVQLSNEHLRLPRLSRTFHGRDVFAPAAAHLAAGVLLDEFGPELGSLTLLDLPEPRRTEKGVAGTIIHLDRFGNAISNIPGDGVPRKCSVHVSDATVAGLANSYQDRAVVALIGSAGYLEVAVRNGSAASRYGLSVGDPVEVRW